MEYRYVTENLPKLGDKLVYCKDLLCKYHVFIDRIDAGKKLAGLLQELNISKENSLILAIPRGGMPVAYNIACKLNIPVDLMICRKILIPWNTEAGFGAVSPDGTFILNEYLVMELGLADDIVQNQVEKALKEMERLCLKFRGTKEYFINARTVVLVDDGIASGYTMLAAVKFVRKFNPANIIIATPTAPISSLIMLSRDVNKIVCLNVRSSLFGFAVADAYHVWYDLSDEEVLKYINELEKRGLWYPKKQVM